MKELRLAFMELRLAFAYLWSEVRLTLTWKLLLLTLRVTPMDSPEFPIVMEMAKKLCAADPGPNWSEIKARHRAQAGL